MPVQAQAGGPPPRHGWRAARFIPWVLYATGAAAQAPLTLEQAINLGLRDNPALAVARYDIDIARLGVGIEDAAFRFIASPVVRGEVGKDGASSLVGVGGSQLLRTGQQFSGTVGLTTAGSADPQLGVVVQIEQPLFRRSGRLIAEAGLDAAQRQDRRAQRAETSRRAALALDVVRQYTGLLEQQGRVASAEQALDRGDRFLRLVSARESVGKLSRVDTLRAELQLGRARAALQDSRSAQRSAQDAFAQLLGKPAGSVFELVRPPVPLYAEVDAGTVLGVAERHRVELAQARDDEDAAQRSLAVAARGVLPDLRVSVGYRDLGLLDNATPFSTSGPFIGVSAGLDLDRARAEGRVAQERLRLEQSAGGAGVQHDNIAREVADSVRERQAAYEGQQLAARNQEFAQRQLDLAQRLFELGRESALTVSQAEDQLQQSELARLAADSRVVVAAYALARAAGTLLESPETAAPLASLAPR